MLALYLIAVAIPLMAIIKRPTAFLPPRDTEGEAYRLYLKKLAERLRKNMQLVSKEIDPTNMDTIEEALNILNGKADDRIKTAASNVFIMTAISQYGALDAVIVALARFRMIYWANLLLSVKRALCSFMLSAMNRGR